MKNVEERDLFITGDERTSRFDVENKLNDKARVDAQSLEQSY